MAKIPGAAAYRRTTRDLDIKSGKEDMWNGETRFLRRRNVSPLADLNGSPSAVPNAPGRTAIPGRIEAMFPVLTSYAGDVLP